MNLAENYFGFNYSVVFAENHIEAVLLMEDYYSDQTGYFAYDLRKFFKDRRTMTVDIKLYLCGGRIVASSGENMGVGLKKGDWMLLDFMRLEPAGQ